MGKIDSGAVAAQVEDAPRRWSADTRLRFIEARLFWDGQVNRADLTRAFGISVPQATTDLKQYGALAAGNFQYDTRLKTYVAASEGFAPVFDTPDAEAWLETCAGTPGAAVEAIPLPARRMDPFLVRRLAAAQREGLALRVRYQAMDRPSPAWFWASPQRFASDHLRWHVRVFNQDADRFEDWLFPRILQVSESRRAATPPPDIGWLTTVDVRLAPAARLPASQRAVIAQDYGMVGGRVVIRVRLALLFLFWRRLALDRPDGLVDAENRAEVEALLEAQRLRYATNPPRR